MALISRHRIQRKGAVHPKVIEEKINGDTKYTVASRKP